MSDIVIVNGARTAFGAFGGGLATQTATDLAVHAAKGAIDRAGVDKDQIDSVVMGNVIQTSKDAIYLGRHVGLRIGLKESTPGLILNLLCGSGVQAVATAAMQIKEGQSSMVLAGGTDREGGGRRLVNLPAQTGGTALTQGPGRGGEKDEEHEYQQCHSTLAG